MKSFSFAVLAVVAVVATTAVPTKSAQASNISDRETAYLVAQFVHAIITPDNRRNNHNRHDNRRGRYNHPYRTPRYAAPQRTVPRWYAEGRRVTPDYRAYQYSGSSYYRSFSQQTRRVAIPCKPGWQKRADGLCYRFVPGR